MASPRPSEPQENLLQAVRDNGARHIEFWDWRIAQLMKTIRESQDEINELTHKKIALQISLASITDVTRETRMDTLSNGKSENEQVSDMPAINS